MPWSSVTLFGVVPPDGTRFTSTRCVAADTERRDVVGAGVHGKQPAAIEGERALGAQAGGTRSGTAGGIRSSGGRRAVAGLRVGLDGVRARVRLA